MPLTYIFPTTTCLQDLNLPPAVNGENTEHRMAIAFAWEERNSLQAEVDLASRRCRQMLFAAQTYAVRAERLSEQLDAATKRVHVSVQNIVDKRTSYSGSDVQNGNRSCVYHLN